MTNKLSPGTRVAFALLGSFQHVQGHKFGTVLAAGTRRLHNGAVIPTAVVAFEKGPFVEEAYVFFGDSCALEVVSEEAVRYLVQQFYPRGGWVTEDEYATLGHARAELEDYRRVNQGRTRLRIVKRTIVEALADGTPVQTRLAVMS